MLYLGMSLDVVVGLQRGDEGKGRFVDLVADQYAIIARGNGGANAGHTVVPDTMEPLALHQVPSGITRPGKLNIIGNGVYVDPRRLVSEIAEVRAAGYVVSPDNLLISDMAHLVLPHHVGLDTLREEGLGSGQYPVGHRLRGIREILARGRTPGNYRHAQTAIRTGPGRPTTAE